MKKKNKLFIGLVLFVVFLVAFINSSFASSSLQTGSSKFIVTPNIKTYFSQVSLGTLGAFGGGVITTSIFSTYLCKNPELWQYCLRGGIDGWFLGDGIGGIIGVYTASILNKSNGNLPMAFIGGFGGEMIGFLGSEFLDILEPGFCTAFDIFPNSSYSLNTCKTLLAISTAIGATIGYNHHQGMNMLNCNCQVMVFSKEGIDLIKFSVPFLI